MKTKTTSAIFAFFFGGIGVHRFYLGQVGLGFLYLLFCWTFIPYFIAVIDGIIFLTMDDDSFNRKYNSETLFAQENYTSSNTQGNYNPPQSITVNNNVVYDKPLNHNPNSENGESSGIQILNTDLLSSERDKVNISSHKNKITELQQLKQLLDADILTLEEFNEEKAKILDHN